MSFDEEHIDQHGECAAEIARLRAALSEIARYTNPRQNFEYIAVSMQAIARNALKQ